MLKNVHVRSCRILSNGKHLRFDVDMPYGTIQALKFNCPQLIEEYKNKKTISFIGKLKINKYLNKESINMIIEDMK